MGVADRVGRERSWQRGGNARVAGMFFGVRLVFAKKAGARMLDLPTMVGAQPGIKTIWDKWDRVVSMLTPK